MLIVNMFTYPDERPTMGKTKIVPPIMPFTNPNTVVKSLIEFYDINNNKSEVVNYSKLQR